MCLIIVRDVIVIMRYIDATDTGVTLFTREVNQYVRDVNILVREIIFMLR